MAQVLPPTRERFLQMDFFSQIKVKQNLLQGIFDDVCETMTTKRLPAFAYILYKDDLEVLKKSAKYDSESSVICDLLLLIERTLKRSPTWWEVLERVLQQDGCWELYYAMNPWEDKHRRVAGAGRGDGCGGDKGAVCRGGSTPDTSGRSGVDAGLTLGDQLEIIAKSQTNGPPMDQFIQCHGEAAMVDGLVNALQGLSPEGQRVLREQARLVHPVERAGNVDGDVVDVVYDGEREGGARPGVMSSEAPAPRSPVCSLPVGVKPTVDDLTNLSCGKHHKEKQQDTVVFTGKEESSLTSVDQPVPKVNDMDENKSTSTGSIDSSKQLHVVVCSDGAAGKKEKTLNCPSVSSLPGAKEQTPARKTPQQNSPLGRETAPSPRQAFGGAIPQEIEDQVLAESRGDVFKVLQSCPSSSAQLQKQMGPTILNIGQVEKLIIGQEKEMVYKSKCTDQGVENAGREGIGGSEYDPPTAIAGNANCREFTGVIQSLPTEQESRESEQNGRSLKPCTLRSSYHPHPTDVTVHQTQSKQIYQDHNEEEEHFRVPEEPLEGEEACMLRSSYHPHPTDVGVHQTQTKQIYQDHNEEEEHFHVPDEPLEGEDDFDLRENITGHADISRNGSGDILIASSCGETEEADSNHSVGPDPILSSHSTQHNLISGQLHPPPSRPQQQNNGEMTLSRVWGTSLKEAILGPWYGVM